MVLLPNEVDWSRPLVTFKLLITYLFIEIKCYTRFEDLNPFLLSASLEEILYSFVPSGINLCIWIRERVDLCCVSYGDIWDECLGGSGASGCVVRTPQQVLMQENRTVSASISVKIGSVGEEVVSLVSMALPWCYYVECNNWSYHYTKQRYCCL